MTPEQAAALRKPFPDAAVGKLPKPYKKDSPRGECKVCGGYHGLPAVHLDYVGHAAATDRLLQVDCEWTWEPFALTEQGLPALDREGNLWIRLTIAGVTRPGVGDGNSMKERIGDAIRNAAMRFGVALDLWTKEDLHDTLNPSEARAKEPAAEIPSSAGGRADGTASPAALVDAPTRPPSGGGSTVKDLMAEIPKLSPDTRQKLISAAKAEGIDIISSMPEEKAKRVYEILTDIDKEF
jgi:hypothetical protein